MFNFDLYKTPIYQAVRWGERWEFKFASAIGKVFLIFFILFFLSFLFNFTGGEFSAGSSARVLGLSFFFLVFGIFFRLQNLFFNSKLKNPETESEIGAAATEPEKHNLAEFLDYAPARAAAKSLEWARAKKIPEITSTALFYFILIDKENSVKLDFIFFRALFSREEITRLLKKAMEEKEEVRRDFFADLKQRFANLFEKNRDERSGEIKYSKDFQETMTGALALAVQKGHQRIELGDILAGLAKSEPVFSKILVDFGLKADDIANLAVWLENLETREAKRKKFWEYENLTRYGTLAKEWTSGYSITLDRFSIDLTETIKRREGQMVGHERELKAIERILSRYKTNNVLLVGEPGAGRKTIINDLARRSFLGQSLPEVNYKRVIELDLTNLLASTTTTEEAESIINTIFEEVVSAGNIILVIKEFHNFVGGKLAPGMIDISGILPPYLASPKFQVVAITTYAGLHKYIEEVPSVLNLFDKVETDEISKEETLKVLENLVPVLEYKHKRFISYPAIRDVINYAERYFPNLPFPKKAMDLLDEAAVYAVASTKDKAVLPRHISWIVSEKIQIPVGEMEVKEKEILLNLENLIHQRIINQEEAVKEVSAALRRARAEVASRGGPMGTFLFLGPTGVGKTETSKALAEIYFHSESRMIRLDMSEFQNVSDVSRLLGSSGEEGLLVTPVRENPFSLLLLDEIEKAHPNILNLFLQVLDEGRLTDGLGRRVDFKNTIIIATSNAGYKIILEAIKEKTDFSRVKQKLFDRLFQEGTFRPEFINRFDAVVIFKPLTKENLLRIAELMLRKTSKALKEKGIEFVITPALKEKTVEFGYDPVFGARNMKRVIQDKIENVLAMGILSGQLSKGSKVEIDPEKLTLIISNSSAK